MTTTATSAPANKVRPGDWIIIQESSRIAYIGRPVEISEHFTPAKGTQCKRDGTAVSWEDVRGYAMGARGRVWTVPAGFTQEHAAHAARILLDAHDPARPYASSKDELKAAFVQARGE